jgi:hypothetical protein
MQLLIPRSSLGTNIDGINGTNSTNGVNGRKGSDESKEPKGSWRNVFLGGFDRQQQ